MHLSEALDCSSNYTATLIVTEHSDPRFLGSPESEMVIYVWVRGHTVPVVVYGLSRDKPSIKDQERCVCGDYHGFPDGRRELIFRLHLDYRWGTMFPVWRYKSPLEALAHVSGDEGIDKHEIEDDH